VLWSVPMVNKLGLRWAADTKAYIKWECQDA
jgi:hypothetical protein